METIPTDVLFLIFKAYTQDLGESPTRLLRVCRRWNNLAVYSPTLWSRIDISVKSIHTIPSILNKEYQGLGLYLGRSEGPNGPAPLEIKIKWLRANPADHLFTCLVTPQDVIDCPESRCNLISTRKTQLRRLLQELAAPSRHPVTLTPELKPRVSCWMTLELDFEGFFDGHRTRGSISLSPLGSGEYSVLPHLDSLIIKNAEIPRFHLIAPELRNLELDNARLGGGYPAMGWLKKLTFRGTNNFDAIKWDACHRLMILEVSRIPGWTLPADVSFDSLSAIIVHPCATLGTLESIGELFNEAKFLPTLSVLGMSPEGLAFLLLYARKLRCHNLNIASHCYQRIATFEATSKSKTTEGAKATKGAPLPKREFQGFEITRGDVQATAYILQEMKLRGTRVNPLDNHMQTIIVLAKLMYPDS